VGRSQRRAGSRLTFAQIEGLIGAPLPKAAAYMAWWHDDQSGVQSRAWLDAGFNAKLIEEREFVIFGRCETRARGVIVQRRAE